VIKERKRKCEGYIYSRVNISCCISKNISEKNPTEYEFQKLFDLGPEDKF
jgi:hypothetical protein